MKNVAKILVCSALFLLMVPGCDITLGPKVETDVVLVHAGTPIICTENKTVRGRMLNPSGAEDSRFFDTKVGGWIMFDPEHWASVKAQHERYKKQIEELKQAVAEEKAKNVALTMALAKANLQ